MKPTVALYFDPETQVVRVDVNQEQAKTWEFVKALLSMGLDAADRTAKMAAMQQMQAQAQEQLSNQKLARTILNGR